jgi:hypothetical protein
MTWYTSPMHVDDPLGIQTLRVDPETGIDLEQLERSLARTVDERLDAYFEFMEFVQIMREARRQHYGMELRPPPDPYWTGD